jgi:hypothetical protein
MKISVSHGYDGVHLDISGYTNDKNWSNSDIMSKYGGHGIGLGTYDEGIFHVSINETNSQKAIYDVIFECARLEDAYLADLNRQVDQLRKRIDEYKRGVGDL